VRLFHAFVCLKLPFSPAFQSRTAFFPRCSLAAVFVFRTVGAVVLFKQFFSNRQLDRVENTPCCPFFCADGGG